jgi:hypothetical protein
MLVALDSRGWYTMKYRNATEREALRQRVYRVARHRGHTVNTMARGTHGTMWVWLPGHAPWDAE